MGNLQEVSKLVYISPFLKHPQKSLLISTLVGHDTAWGIPYIFYTLIYNNGHLIICQTIRNIVTHPLISHLSRSNPL